MISDKEMIDFLDGCTALYVNKANALVNGRKVRIKNAPIMRDETIMLPADFFAGSIGVEMIDKNGFVELRSGEKTMELGDENKIDGVYYVSALESCKLFGKHLHTENNGIIIYSDRDMSSKLSWETNLKMMRKISESYMFEDISGKELAERIKAANPGNKHPRMIMTEEKFEEIRKEIEDPNGDKVYKILFERLKKKADEYMTERTSGYEIRDGVRLLYVCRENKKRMMTLAMIYNLTRDEKYAERAYMEMYTCACFVDWHPFHFLDVGEMAAAMGICYDWLYNWMAPWQRKPIRDAIVINGVHPIIEDFDDKPRERSWNWRGEFADNWRFVIGGVGIGAMAVVDEMQGEELENCERAIEQTLIDIRRSLSLFAPNGGYEEGIMYWGLSMEFFTYHMRALMTSIGEDLGYVDVPGMRNTNRYLFSMNGSVSVFNYHDCGDAKAYIPPQTMFLADYFGNYEEALPRIDRILNGGEASVSDMFLYNKKFSRASTERSELNTYMPIAETVTMRSGWGKNDIYVGFHCDDPYGAPGHDHMDAGQFVIDALGESFFIDLGPDDYNLSNYHDTYRFRAEGHNTVIFDPSMDYGQKYGGKAEIERYQFSENGGFAVGNMTDAYEKTVSFRRGIMLNTIDKKVILTDEIKLSTEASMLWSAHTCADITLSKDKKTAKLEINSKTLFAHIVNCDKAEFCVLDAKPLPTSPIVEGQDENKGIRKLAIWIEGVTELCLTVVFDEKQTYNGEALPISDWQI